MREKSGMKAVAFTLSLLLCASLFLCNFSVYAQDNGGTGSEVVETSEEQTDELSGENNADTSKEGVSQVEEGDIDSSEPSSESDQKDEKTEGVFNEKKESPKAKKAPALRAEQNNVITGIEALLQDGSGPVGDTITQWQTFRIKANFELPNNTVKEGDTTTIQLPEKLRFAQTASFQITDAAGNVVANAVVDGANKTLTLTYTDYPENNSDVSGDFFFYVRMDRQVVEGETDIPLDFVINNQVISAGSVHFDGYPTPSVSIVSKS